jgi:hypothetical protein
MVMRWGRREGGEEERRERGGERGRKKREGRSEGG